MLSKVDLRDFFEINQGLYGEPVTPVHLWLAQAWSMADAMAALPRDPHSHEHATQR